VPRVLYCVSVTVDAEVRDEWLAWMERIHVPDILREPGFERAAIHRDTADDARFVIHYELSDREALDRYFAGAAARLRAKYEAHYGGRARASRQVLEVVAVLAPKG
jgi:quinol monooxygenase YgiN